MSTSKISKKTPWWNLRGTVGTVPTTTAVLKLCQRICGVRRARAPCAGDFPPHMTAYPIHQSSDSQWKIFSSNSKVPTNILRFSGVITSCVTFLKLHMGVTATKRVRTFSFKNLSKKILSRYLQDLLQYVTYKWAVLEACSELLIFCLQEGISLSLLSILHHFNRL